MCVCVFVLPSFDIVMLPKCINISLITQSIFLPSHATVIDLKVNQHILISQKLFQLNEETKVAVSRIKFYESSIQPECEALHQSIYGTQPKFWEKQTNHNYYPTRQEE